MSLFGMVLKRLKLPKLFNGVARTFPTHKHIGVERGKGIWKFSKKCCFHNFEWWKPIFHHFWPTL